jgi:hypothetical protein
MSVTVDEVSRMASALPQVTEQDHHGMTSFLLCGKIFATVPDEEHLRVMVGEGEIHAAVFENPAVFHAFYWGTRLTCLVIISPMRSSSGPRTAQRGVAAKGPGSLCPATSINASAVEVVDPPTGTTPDTA